MRESIFTLNSHMIHQIKATKLCNHYINASLESSAKQTRACRDTKLVWLSNLLRKLGVDQTFTKSNGSRWKTRWTRPIFLGVFKFCTIWVKFWCVLCVLEYHTEHAKKLLRFLYQQIEDENVHTYDSSTFFFITSNVS